VLFVVVLLVSGGIVAAGAAISKGLSHSQGIFTLNLSAPTQSELQPDLGAFCRDLQGEGGLQALVDKIGSGGVNNSDMLQLDVAVMSAPTSIQVPMLTLYKQMLKGHPDSPEAVDAIQTVYRENPCI
jgi:hypothetical protein